MIEWSDEFSVGVPRIDFEHKILFGLINDFERARLSGAGQDVLRDVLLEITAYTKYHFLREEHMLCRMGYPDLDYHREQHFQFMDILHSKVMSQTSGVTKSPEVGDFLLKWFIEHIKCEDAKYASFKPSTPWRPV
jgi:hemerythrin